MDQRRRVALEKIRLLAAKCIKGYLQPPCRACEDVCPAGAIRWGVPDAELCVDCGLCTAVCPAAAIETRLDYAARLAAAAAAPVVRLACAKDAPETQLPCLGFLTRGILWSLASKKEVQLVVGACRSCLPAVHAHLVREAALVRAALEAAGKTTLRLLDEEPAARAYSRRDFFRRFRDVAREKFGEEAGEDLRAGAAGMRDEDAAYPALAAFDGFWWSFADGAEPAAVHADLALYSGCNACGFCARLCPHGALTAEIDGADFVLSFTPQLCSACGLCTVRCPRNALRLAASPAAKRWRIPLPRCASCAAPFQPIGASKTCRACMEK